jgi:NitT/TauT family transport system ATP-binding protein
MRQVRGDEIGLIFQEPMTSLNPVLTVGAQIVQAIRLHREVSARAAAAEAESLLRLVEIDAAARRAASYPHQLSGGMRQRAAICRALVHDPDILLMDEPFSALDAITRDEMNDVLLDIWERTPKTALFVTHSIREAVYLADRVLVMNRRPATVVADIAVNLARPRDPAMGETPAFNEICARLRGLIEHSHRAARAATPGIDEAA